MLRLSLFLTICLVVALVQATGYKLQDDYTENFFDKFNFFTEPDPTSGWVDYVDFQNASDCGLIQSTNPPKWGVDDTTVLSPGYLPGRPSIRLTSKNLYNHGLFILDLAHMPDSTCGVWPAFWTFSQTATWPVGGEVDIIEFVNTQRHNLMTLHTADGCSVTGDLSLMSGALSTSAICDVCICPFIFTFLPPESTLKDKKVSQGNGCTINATNAYSAGTGFNERHGGVYAMEWTSDFIQMWFFPDGYVPKTIKDGTPDPIVDFGKPLARFQGSCDMDKHFYDHAIIFDLTFCGSWAGETYKQDGCPMTSGQDSWPSCIAYVAQNPSAYKNAYWEVNSLKVYQVDPSSPVPSASAGSSATPAAYTSEVPLTTQSSALGASTTPSNSISSRSSPEVSSSASAVSSSPVVSSTSSTSTAASSTSATPTKSKYYHGPDWDRGHQRRGRIHW